MTRRLDKRERFAKVSLNPVIRHYRPGDREAVRTICYRTACRGKEGSPFLEVREILQDYLTRFYTDWTPETVWVVERSGQVVGYLLGCADSRRHLHVTIRKIVPALLLKMLLQATGGRFRSGPTKKLLKWIFLQSWREIPGVPLESYASHFHCNLLPAVTGAQCYTKLALMFFREMEGRGVCGFHAQILEPERGPFKRMLDHFLREYPGQDHFYTETASTFHRDVLGSRKKMVHRVWGGDLATAKAAFAFMRDHYHL